MTLLILVLMAFVLTFILKWEYTSSYILWLGTLFILCDETKLLLVPFLIIVEIQVRMIKDEFKRSGVKDLRLFLKQREINHA